MTGSPFNQAYRYVEWLLTVPLLLIALILGMKPSRGETVSRSVWPGGAAALMIILGYPGEVADMAGVRLTFRVLSIIPFLYIVCQLVMAFAARSTAWNARQPMFLLSTSRSILVRPRSRPSGSSPLPGQRRRPASRFISGKEAENTLELPMVPRFRITDVSGAMTGF
jgi:hypothetical protein